MDLLDEESHRLLLWAVRLQEVGGAPLGAELRQLARPRRAPGESIAIGLSGRPAEFAESALDSLLRRGLIEDLPDDRVAPTELGRVVVSALGLHPDEMPLFEVIDGDLRSSDPLGFARVAGRIAALDRPMLVDPYCRRDQLEYLITHTSISKVLVSDRLDAEDLAEIADLVDSLRRRDTRLKVRVAPAAAVNDRHVIDRDRVMAIASTATAPAATVISEPFDLASAVREYYRSVWQLSAKLASYRPKRPSAPKKAA